MIYLNAFCLPSRSDEANHVVNDIRLDMTCYAVNNAYPFHIFPEKELTRLDFSTITILYGSNGSGKSTLLNILSQKLKLSRTTPFNRTPFLESYLSLCRYETAGEHPLPEASCMITSDDVFDFMLNLRTLNDGVDRDRERLFEEWRQLRNTGGEPFRMRSLADYEAMRQHIDAYQHTRSDYTARRLPSNVPVQSNGESAYGYFADKIRGHALYLLDEPENSLSAERQLELATFLSDSARFYGCQFILATHSPFLLAMHGARIYDLDARPVTVKRWTELENVCLYHDFFEAHRAEFTDR